ncbi:MAG: hypothetical protein WDO71_00690 [Bacteroidota bacterium]
MFQGFRKYKAVLSGVTFWNISDRASWLDNFPVPEERTIPYYLTKN